MVEVCEGVRRVTFPLPFGIDHVHCYLLEGEGGGEGWTLVDTGIGLPGAAERWRELLAELGAPVDRIVVTHYHPDHVGGAADVAALTGAPVYQGRLDYEQCLTAWASEATRGRVLEHLRLHGMPGPEAEAVWAHQAGVASWVHFARDPEPLEPGERIAGWEVLHLPGHADGHLCLLREGVLVAGDALLDQITPNIGLWPSFGSDPLGEYLTTLDRVVSLAPSIALPGHHEPIRNPAARAREIHAHHQERLQLVLGALDGSSRSAYEVSHALFEGELPAALRRFALAESLSHLEYLALRGEIERREARGGVRYARA